MFAASAQPPDAYAGMRAARRPPSRRHTGAPTLWPRMSHSAMSMPLIAQISMPRRPRVGKTWPCASA